MSVTFSDAPALLLILPLAWWAIVLYCPFRFLRAFELAVEAREEIARELGHVAHRLDQSGDSRSVP